MPEKVNLPEEDRLVGPSPEEEGPAEAETDAPDMSVPEPEQDDLSDVPAETPGDVPDPVSAVQEGDAEPEPEPENEHAAPEPARSAQAPSPEPSVSPAPVDPPVNPPVNPPVTETPVSDAPGDEEQSLFEAPPESEQDRMVEAILFAVSEPITVGELNARMPHGGDAARALERLRKRYEGRGVQVVRIGERWAIRTAPDLGFLMQKESVETRKLSRAAIETLAIIAYHQPVTRAEIEEIRGVSVSRGTIDLLLEMEWIRFGRRRMTPGRPVTFVVTPAFLDHFGLESARDLPGLRELRAAGLLENRPPPGSDPEDADGEGQGDMFEAEDPAPDDENGSQKS